MYRGLNASYSTSLHKLVKSNKLIMLSIKDELCDINTDNMEVETEHNVYEHAL